MNRRTFVKTTALASLSLPLAGGRALPRLNKGMGIAAASYVARWRPGQPGSAYPAFRHAGDMLEHAAALGAAGIQAGVANWQADFATSLRHKREQLGLYLEGQIRLPGGPEDLARFEQEVLRAKEAGAAVLRTVCLSGRRYETFDSAEAFGQFTAQAFRSVALAEPIVRKHRVKLAIENHKDWRIAEMLKLLEHIQSEWMGVTLDTGNNIALLEDPLEVVRALAPYTFSIHFKDMACREYEQGFLLAEVPLGSGFLDLKEMIRLCEANQPGVNYNLEMITRDPLKIPCLSEHYWATFGELPARELARTLRKVRQQPSAQPLPAVAGKSLEEQLALEEEHIQQSFVYARQQLGFK